jgi:LPXTG-site transpeptidase (sortase) family protein
MSACSCALLGLRRYSYVRIVQVYPHSDYIVNKQGLKPPIVLPTVETDGLRRAKAHKVNAPVENVNIQSNGDLGTPQQNQWEGVGWYRNGPRPGEVGSAVIDGHLDRPGGYPAVFWDLKKVHVGETIMVVDAKGKTLRFRVTRTASYAPQEAPVQEIFGDAGGKYLNLITCAGTWIPSQKQTTLRLVVYSVLMQ